MCTFCVENEFAKAHFAVFGFANEARLAGRAKDAAMGMGTVLLSTAGSEARADAMQQCDRYTC